MSLIPDPDADFIKHLEACLAHDASQSRTVRELKRSGDKMIPRWDFASALSEIIEDTSTIRQRVLTNGGKLDGIANSVADLKHVLAHLGVRMMTALEALTAAAAKISTAIDANAAEQTAAMDEIKALVAQISTGSTDPAVQAIADQISAKADSVIAGTVALKVVVDAASAPAVPPAPPPTT